MAAGWTALKDCLFTRLDPLKEAPGNFWTCDRLVIDAYIDDGQQACLSISPGWWSAQCMSGGHVMPPA